MDAELEFAIQPSTTGKQLFDQVCAPLTRFPSSPRSAVLPPLFSGRTLPAYFLHARSPVPVSVRLARAKSFTQQSLRR